MWEEGEKKLMGVCMHISSLSALCVALVHCVLI